MSGGTFNYAQHMIRDIYEELEDIISRVESGDSGDECYESMETHKEFKNAINILKKAYIYAHRIDWFLSGDDGEDFFHKRLREELTKLEEE